ncbi:MAG: UDP-N-acetylmuramate dehydrogenase [Spirochaetaceae bacterium]|jgi:UDP-N-acetylmuramate dehydrogenase|nr:UDP-N-acetylmuramate dehydrogenase [Spirochaetaceae bacterium]
MNITIPDILIPYIQKNENMSTHTTFKTGGNADYYIKPPRLLFISLAKECIKWTRKNNIPLLILGGGANLCVSDNGVRGLVLDTSDFSEFSIEKNESIGGGTEGSSAALRVSCGVLSDEAARFACANSLSGLEFLSGLPGTIGGALYMNARCFEKEISGIFIDAMVLNKNYKIDVIKNNTHEWAYKKSPFQNRNILILSARFKVEYGIQNDISSLCAYYKKQREEKGHYRFPSAGSVFKNNHAFGKPSGKIIDELGLRGVSIGGAQIAPWHGNFIINTGGATSAGIRALVELVKNEARNRAGLELEEEILFAGDWA